ncbi:MAG TPA: ferrochelatase [Planctomycetota bacterium]|nr:ferrochelatase [Planctomycetota bacterium]
MNVQLPGVLLVNIGTPDSPSVRDVRAYLGEFLMDRRVIDLPAPLRWLLVHGAILRTRPARSAAAYRSIWTDRGSPLRVHTEDLAAGLRRALEGEVAAVEVAMRYQKPSIAAALQRCSGAGIDHLVVVPLYPQYSAAAWASTFDAVTAAAARLPVVPSLSFLPPFHREPLFLDAIATVARPRLVAFAPDRVLMSFHGLPEQHIRAADRSGSHCLASADCCAQATAANAGCYRAQCYATAAGIAARLGLAAAQYEVAFQSRLSRKWIQPFTDRRLRELAATGCRRLAVLCPAFVADCLETVEEIGIRARADFRAAGGDDLCLVPCVNAAPEWVSGLAALVRAHLPRPAAVAAPRRLAAAVD